MKLLTLFILIILSSGFQALAQSGTLKINDVAPPASQKEIPVSLLDPITVPYHDAADADTIYVKRLPIQKGDAAQTAQVMLKFPQTRGAKERTFALEEVWKNPVNNERVYITVSGVKSGRPLTPIHYTLTLKN